MNPTASPPTSRQKPSTPRPASSSRRPQRRRGGASSSSSKSVISVQRVLCSGRLRSSIKTLSWGLPLFMWQRKREDALRRRSRAKNAKTRCADAVAPNDSAVENCTENCMWVRHCRAPHLAQPQGALNTLHIIPYGPLTLWIPEDVGGMVCGHHLDVPQPVEAPTQPRNALLSL